MSASDFMFVELGLITLAVLYWSAWRMPEPPDDHNLWWVWYESLRRKQR